LPRAFGPRFLWLDFTKGHQAMALAATHPAVPPNELLALPLDGLPASPLDGLLASLPAGELDELKARLTPVLLVRGQVLAECGEPVDHAYFIESGVMSVISAPTDQGRDDGVQVAMIGQEGMVGDLSLVDMRHPACAHFVVHIPGAALRLPSVDLQRLIERSPALHAACARFVRSLVAQVMQTAVCNTRRSVTERCARWLAMTHDRVDGDEVQVTHEALSAMLGLHRPGVTVAAAALQQAGLIRTRRGCLTVLDRAGLHAFAQGSRSASQAAPPRARPQWAGQGQRPPAADSVL